MKLLKLLRESLRGFVNVSFLRWNCTVLLSVQKKYRKPAIKVDRIGEEEHEKKKNSLAKVMQAASGRARTNTLSLIIPSPFLLSSENALFQALAICWSLWVKLDQNISMKNNHFYVPRITLNNLAAEVS